MFSTTIRAHLCIQPSNPRSEIGGFYASMHIIFLFFFSLSIENMLMRTAWNPGVTPETDSCYTEFRQIANFALDVGLESQILQLDVVSLSAIWAILFIDFG